MISVRAAAAVLPLLLGPSCVLYLRFRADEPVDAAALGTLRPGTTDLASALAALGAPLRVFEHQGDGIALLWAWRDVDDWSLEVSVPVTDQANANFELDLTDTELPGCMLWFDGALRLERWRRGTLGELLPARVRPSAPAERG